jgi:antitoxin (DNA-binding transcriptional repressor) of toxin-antitoxin stability system
LAARFVRDEEAAGSNPATPTTSGPVLVTRTGLRHPRLDLSQAADRRVEVMSEIPLDEAPREVSDAAHDAARGKVVYLTEHGERLAAIVPAELAAELENLTPQEFRELLEDFADGQAAREALAEVEAGAEPVPAEQVWTELGIEP